MAIRQARENGDGFPSIKFQVADIRQGFPTGKVDLRLFSDVLSDLSPRESDTTLDEAARNVKPDRPNRQGNRAKNFWTNQWSAESVAIHRITYGWMAVDSWADETEAVYETVVFLEYVNDLPDARQSGKVKYPLDEILLLCLFAVLAGADTITDIAKYGRHKLEFLRQFRPFADGTPAHDHLGDILAALDAEQFQRCFVAWVAARTGVSAEVIAIDGKTLRRSGSKTSKKKKQNLPGPIHIVSAFAAGQRLVLGQVKVGEKSNEIVAIPKLLKLLAIEGAVVTIDAMGCQRDIAQTIIEKKADYILALKGNQGTLNRGPRPSSAINDTR